MTAAAEKQLPITDENGKILCHIDNTYVHSIHIHIRDNHSSAWSVERYQAEFPDAPLLSTFAMQKLKKAKAAKEKSAEASVTLGLVTEANFEIASLHEAFDFGSSAAALNKRGDPISIKVMKNHAPEDIGLVPDVDENYVFDIERVKIAVMAFELNMPILFWGYHGTGKTTLLEQVCARTKRCFMRVQHTINTEESHIVGQYIVKDGATQFQLGPLPMAMLAGYVYCADEYDFAMPSVLSVYQPVLEGKALFIKDAPPEYRIIKPHANFRFAATGNTNGGGDETGLYQGTQMQNAANYSRFKIVEEVKYMDEKVEAAVVSGQSGVQIEDARRLVRFAGEVREAFANGTISSTISPRELISMAYIARIRGFDWKSGVALGFSNRLNRIDKKVIDGFVQRLFPE
jgi:cobaltochelatase CobS